MSWRTEKVKDCPTPAIARERAAVRLLEAGVGQSSREETAHAVGAALWGIDRFWCGVQRVAAADWIA